MYVWIFFTIQTWLWEWRYILHIQPCRKIIFKTKSGGPSCPPKFNTVVVQCTYLIKWRVKSFNSSVLRPNRTAGRDWEIQAKPNNNTKSFFSKYYYWWLLLLVPLFGNLLNPVISDTLLSFITFLPPPLPPLHHVRHPLLMLLLCCCCCCRCCVRDFDVDKNLRLSLIIISDRRYRRSDGCTSLHLWWIPLGLEETMILCSNLLPLLLLLLTRSKLVVVKSPSFLRWSKHPTATTDSLSFPISLAALSRDLLNDVGSKRWEAKTRVLSSPADEWRPDKRRYPNGLSFTVFSSTTSKTTSCSWWWSGGGWVSSTRRISSGSTR